MGVAVEVRDKGGGVNLVRGRKRTSGEPFVVVYYLFC